MAREPVVFFRGAMDAEQRRDADGRFGSGGGAIEAPNLQDAQAKQIGQMKKLKADLNEFGGPLHQWDRLRSLEKTYKNHPGAKDSEQPPFPASMQGEAGRQARQQARDCMSGRFRP